MSVHGTGPARRALKLQDGMVLLLCLIFLMSLTLLGLSASADTLLQNRLTSNLQESERAKQSALSALSWVEYWLLEMEGPAPAICVAPCEGLKLHSTGGFPARPEFEDYSWWLEQGHEAGIDPLNGDRITAISSGSFKPPAFIVEVVQSVPPAENGTPDLQVWYRILARGSGQSETAVSVIESMVVRSWPVYADPESPINGVPGPCPGADPTAVCGRFTWRELR